MRTNKRSAALLVALLMAVTAASGPAVLPAWDRNDAISGPYAFLLAASKNLGPSQAGDAQVTVKLQAAARPDALIEWAASHQMAVRWQPNQAWAIVTGPAANVGKAFDVPIHDFIGRRGQYFYASPMQPAVPATFQGEVTGVGRILSYLPPRMARPVLTRDVPNHGLTPQNLLTAYNATPLAEAGYTGKGQTIVIFAFDGFDQADLDMFADTSNLPRFAPTVIGGQPGEAHGETVMDLEVAHAIAPDAQLVVINARPTVEGGGGTFEKIGSMFDDAAEKFPGSVWSLSIGWGCEALSTATDVTPVRAALVNAHRHGISVFDASGDTAGLECKGGEDWSTPPSAADVGVDTIASLPEITSVGGTSLSTDRQGRWLEEQGWVDPPLSQGSSGGVSQLFERPAYQRSIFVDRDTDHRLVPDIAAVADPFTGVRIVFEQNEVVGGGTSQSAPIWAAMTALMNQYIIDKGGRPLGELNPMLYQIAQGSALPGFQDITAGGNAVDSPVQGYDLVSGLGSPNVDNLARNLLQLQKTQSAAAYFLGDGG